MKKDELEQQLLFVEKRTFELGSRMSALTDENEMLLKKNEELKGQLETLYEQFSKRLKALSDELYQYIGNQNQQLNLYIDSTKKESDGRVLNASNELYQHIANINRVRDEELENYKKQLHDELWMRTFGFDKMISELQLAFVEQIFPGNRSKLEGLKDTHKGERCFVIGNGPSLTAADLDKLKENNIFCFAAKGIYHIFDQTDWRPNIWAASDLGHIDANIDKIAELDGMIKLLCCQALIKLGLKIEDVIYFPFIQAERRPPFFNADVTRGVHFWGTITCKLINFAVYMGFKEIYLLGVDNQYGMKQGKDGGYVYDINAKNHFSDNYLTEKEKKECEEITTDMIQSLEYINLSFEVVRWHCDELGVKIFNATRGGLLETFPRIDFETLI